jgi:hypothetical protein
MAATGLAAAGLAVAGSEGRGLRDGRGLAAAELAERRGLAAAELAVAGPEGRGLRDGWGLAAAELAERRGLAAAELAERRGLAAAALAAAGLAGGRRSTSRFFRACISSCQNKKEKLIRCRYVHYEQGISVKDTVLVSLKIREKKRQNEGLLTI